MRLPAEGPWRGETHRLCDRPGSLERLLEEVRVAGAEQVIVVSAAPPAGAPARAQFGSRPTSRGRAGEQLAAFETADLRDVLEQSTGRFAGLFVIRPVAQSARPAGLRRDLRRAVRPPVRVAELVDRGYEDAYHQFIEPVVARQRRADRNGPILIW